MTATLPVGPHRMVKQAHVVHGSMSVWITASVSVRETLKSSAGVVVRIKVGKVINVHNTVKMVGFYDLMRKA